ncbi:helix-turn-helix domain-containing protein [Streptomyces sp. NBC_01381]|uniref:helix-turn-helix domain-containing protein n=1 Tax=Streptomyces sp. NBC_01381 TaxID=2903845 RepID=UPI00225B4BD1|nr:helix-turn-helix transcriptional regulator [Streptomyces sp. NBC_01381]MCX4673657.1 helix-turn-helix domain-containing protein [Streptomyces sp. NBC_01381]
MPAPTSPTVHRRQLGKELRRLRKDANKELEDAAVLLKCHRTRMSRIENGRGGAVAKPGDVIQLCEFYGVTDETVVTRLLGLLSDSQKQGWWEALELPPGLEAYIGLETDARKESAFEPLLVHGILQTAEYARAILNATRTHRPDDVDDLVKLREGRQQLLTRTEAPLDLWAVMDENVIRRPIGGREAMREQLQHIRDLAQLPNVTIQIFPMDKESHPGLGGAFSLLEFEEDPAVVYVDSPAGNLYLEKERDVRRFVKTFDLLKASARDPDESTALIESAAEEI